MASCEGTSDDHCCYLGAYGVCEHLEENTVPSRRWACGLLVTYGSWDAMYESAEYVEVRRRLRAVGVAEDCGDWPASGKKCGTCGVVSDG